MAVEVYSTAQSQTPLKESSADTLRVLAHVTTLSVPRFAVIFARFFLTLDATLLDQPFLCSDLLKLRITGLQVRALPGAKECKKL